MGLPAHVALDILRQLDARDLCALRATCRAFDFPLVETAAAEACRALAPWLTAPHPGESWVQLLRFAELSERARLPRLVAGEDVTAVVDRAGHLHAWGPVVDVFGEDTSRSPSRPATRRLRPRPRPRPRARPAASRAPPRAERSSPPREWAARPSPSSATPRASKPRSAAPLHPSSAARPAPPEPRERARRRRAPVFLARAATTSRGA